MDLRLALDITMRWIHFVAGITWIGHLYFFNFVNSNFEKTLDADSKKKVVPELRPRALFFFRWGAMLTFLAGVWMYISLWLTTGRLGNMDPGGLWISYGAALGTVMWFNVWFIIWPKQKKIIAAIKGGTAPDPKMVSLAGNASKVNVYLSVPMLFGMAAASHLGNFNGLLVVVVTLVGFAAAWLTYKLAPKVSVAV